MLADMSHRDATDLIPARNAAGHEYALASSSHMLEQPQGIPTRKTNAAPCCMEWLSTVVMRDLLTLDHIFSIRHLDEHDGNTAAETSERQPA